MCEVVEDSPCALGAILSQSGRVPFPLKEGALVAVPGQSQPYPSDHIFPLPLPDIPPVPPRGRGRIRAFRRAEHAKMLSIAVAGVNLLYFSHDPGSAIAPKGVPASGAQYCCFKFKILFRSLIRKILFL